MLTLARVQFQRGRLEELAASQFGLLPADEQQLRYAATSRLRRRLGWRMPRDDLAPGVSFMGKPVPPLPIASEDTSEDTPYYGSFELTRRTLRQRPLDLQSRMNWMYLEFVHQSDQQTVTAVRQAADLFSETPELQLRFGSAAADQANYALAARSWKRATAHDDSMIRRAIHRAIRYKNFPVQDILPDNPPGRSKALQVLRDAGYQPLNLSDSQTQ